MTVTDANGAKGTATVPVTVTGGDQCPTGGLVDDFDGTQLGAAWTVIRPDQTMGVSGGSLNIPAQPGDIYADRNDAKNLVTRPAPDGAWTAVAKLDYEGTSQYHQAGIMVYGDDDNFTKFGRLATNADGNGDEKFEFIYENAGSPRNDAADSTANLPADLPKDYWVRLVSDGTNVTGAYSTDGATWTTVGRPAPLPANAKLGLFAFSNAGLGNPVAKFDSFTLSGAGTGGGGGTPSGPSYDDEFAGLSLDTDRWNAIVRPDAALTNVAGGKLVLTTSPGDIYTGDTNTAAGQLHPPVREPCGRGLGDRDQDRRGDDRRRLRPGWPDRVRRRRQLREARRDLRRRQPADQPARAALGVRGSGRGEPGRSADRGRRHHRLAAADQVR